MVALVLAIAAYLICPVIPAIGALVLASTAARNISESGGRLQGTGIVLAARILAWLNLAMVLVGGALLLGLALTGAIFANSRPSTDTADPSIAGRGGAETAQLYADLRQRGPGTCLNEVTKPEIVPCGEPHDAELFAVVRLEGTTFPGDEGVLREGDWRCRSELLPYVGGTAGAADLAGQNVGPNEASWEAGEREVACLLTSATPGGKLTGSRRGTGG